MQQVVPVAPLLAQSFGNFIDSPPPPIDWLIPGLIPRGAMGFFVSVPNAGKSFLTLQMLLAVATGKPFQGYPANSPLGAIYLSLEDPPEVIHRRLRAIVDVLRLRGEWTAEDEVNLAKNAVLLTPDWGAEMVETGDDRVSPMPTTYLPKLMSTIERAIAELTEAGVPPGILAVDTFAAASEGDENSAKDMKPILAAAYQICGKTGYTAMLVHHASKGQSGARTNDSRSIDQLMAMDWVRGSSAIIGAARFILQLAPIGPKEAEKVSLDGDKARRGGYLVFGASKQSVGPKGEWRVLEQVDHGETGAGSWLPLPNGMDVLAQLKGGKAVEALAKKDQILVELARRTRGGVEPSQKMLAEELYRDAKNPGAAFRSMLGDLRRLGFIRHGGVSLTVKGFERVNGFVPDTNTPSGGTDE